MREMMRFFLAVPTSLHLADRFDQPVDQPSRRCAARIAFHGVSLGLATDNLKPVPQERSGHFKETLVAVDRDAGALHELARIEGQRLDVFEALVESLLAVPRRAPGLEKLRVADWRLVGGGDAVLFDPSQKIVVSGVLCVGQADAQDSIQDVLTIELGEDGKTVLRKNFFRTDLWGGTGWLTCSSNVASRMAKGSHWA